MCGSLDGCWDPIGCSYTVNQEVTKDTVIAAGFLPSQTNFPITIKITNIVGTDVLPVNICPVQQPDDISTAGWLSASTFDTKLFVTLEELDSLVTDGAKNSARNTTTAVGNSPVMGVIVLSLVLALLSCEARHSPIVK